MTEQRRNATLLLALLGALVSVPLPWVTHRQTHSRMFGTVTNNQTGKIISQPVTHSYNHVTGMNGFLQFGITVPLWIVPVLICISCGGRLLGRSAFFDFSSSLLRLLAFISVLLAVLIGILGIAGLLSPNGGFPNLGLLLALAVGLAATRPDATDSTSDSIGEHLTG